MRLTIQKSGDVLADGTTSGSVLVDTLTVDGERMVDVVTQLGAEGILVYDRFTNSHACEFEIEKTHATPEAALYHTIMQRTNVTGDGSLVIQIAGDAVHTFTAYYCAWKTIRTRAEGVASRTSYRVEFGSLEYRATPTGSSLADTLRDPLLTTGPAPGVALFCTPWAWPHGLPSAFDSVTLADMAA